MTAKAAFWTVGLWLVGIGVGAWLMLWGRYVPGIIGLDSHQAFGAWMQYAGIAFLLVVLASFCDSIRSVHRSIKGWWNAPIATQVVNPRLRALAAQPSRLGLLARNAQLIAERRAQEERRQQLLRALGVDTPED